MDLPPQGNANAPTPDQSNPQASQQLDQELGSAEGQMEDTDPVKAIQKMVGKLTEKMRTADDQIMTSEFQKSILNSVVSAIKLEKMEDGDILSVIKKLKGEENAEAVENAQATTPEYQDEQGVDYNVNNPVAPENSEQPLKEVESVDATPDWKNVYSYFMRIRKTDPATFNKMIATMGNEWTKLKDMAIKNGWVMNETESNGINKEEFLNQVRDIVKTELANQNTQKTINPTGSEQPLEEVGAFNDAGEPLMTHQQYRDYSEPSEPEYEYNDYPEPRGRSWSNDPALSHFNEIDWRVVYEMIVDNTTTPGTYHINEFSDESPDERPVIPRSDLHLLDDAGVIYMDGTFPMFDVPDNNAIPDYNTFMEQVQKVKSEIENGTYDRRIGSGGQSEAPYMRGYEPMSEISLQEEIRDDAPSFDDGAMSDILENILQSMGIQDYASNENDIVQAVKYYLDTYDNGEAPMGDNDKFMTQLHNFVNNSNVEMPYSAVPVEYSDLSPLGQQLYDQLEIYDPNMGDLNAKPEDSAQQTPIVKMNMGATANSPALAAEETKYLQNIIMETLNKK